LPGVEAFEELLLLGWAGILLWTPNDADIFQDFSGSKMSKCVIFAISFHGGFAN